MARKWYGLVYVNPDGFCDEGFIVVDTDEGACAEYAHTFDPRGVLEALGGEEPGPADLPRYEIVPLTEAEAEVYEKTEAEPNNDGVADYEMWEEREAQRWAEGYRR